MRKSLLSFAVLLSVFLFIGASGQAGEKIVAKKGEHMGLSALVVKIHMKAEFREQFLKEMWADAIGSEKNEPGCLMFNITHDNANPNILYLFEVYKDNKAVEEHKKAPHFVKWLETTQNWLAAPLEIVSCSTIYPPVNTWEKRPAPKE